MSNKILHHILQHLCFPKYNFTRSYVMTICFSGHTRMDRSFFECNILEVFFVKKDCIGDELVLISGELAAY